MAPAGLPLAIVVIVLWIIVAVRNKQHLGGSVCAALGVEERRCKSGAGREILSADVHGSPGCALPGVRGALAAVIQACEWY